VTSRLPEPFTDGRLGQALPAQHFEVGQPQQLRQRAHRHMKTRGHADRWFEQ
jgi:hypothetical protein